MQDISVIIADITTLECDAIVNAANSSLLGGGGVDGAIHRAAGPKLLEECRSLHGCQTGEAKITSGYNLPSDHVIHTVGPVYSGSSGDSISLASCYTNRLNLARKHNLHSIAFPSISTGVYGYPAQEAARTAFCACISWLQEHQDYSIRIIFCCFDSYTKSLYEKLVTEQR